AATHQTRVAGVRALMRMLKDEDIARGLGLAVSIAKALGQEARQADGPGVPARSS
ncbi:MAG: helical membrane plugin domain-containing protein, partial [Actinomycetes bacterium]